MVPTHVPFMHHVIASVRVGSATMAAEVGCRVRSGLW